MTKEEFINLIGQDLVVEYPFGEEKQLWSMKNFKVIDGEVKHKRLDLITEVFIKNAENPHKGIATHG